MTKKKAIRSTASIIHTFSGVNLIFDKIDNLLSILSSIAVSYGIYVNNEKKRLEFEMKSLSEKVSNNSYQKDILRELLALLRRDVSNSKIKEMPFSVKTKNYSRSLKRKRNKVNRKEVK